MGSLTESGPAIHEDHTQQYRHENDEDDHTDNQQSGVGLDDAGQWITCLPSLLDLDVYFPG